MTFARQALKPVRSACAVGATTQSLEALGEKAKRPRLAVRPHPSSADRSGKLGQASRQIEQSPPGELAQDEALPPEVKAEQRSQVGQSSAASSSYQPSHRVYGCSGTA
jgi:hypothetical protein